MDGDALTCRSDCTNTIVQNRKAMIAVHCVTSFFADGAITLLSLNTEMEVHSGPGFYSFGCNNELF